MSTLQHQMHVQLWHADQLYARRLHLQPLLSAKTRFCMIVRLFLHFGKQQTQQKMHPHADVLCDSTRRDATYQQASPRNLRRHTQVKWDSDFCNVVLSCKLSHLSRSPQQQHSQGCRSPAGASSAPQASSMAAWAHLPEVSQQPRHSALGSRVLAGEACNWAGARAEGASRGCSAPQLQQRGSAAPERRAHCRHVRP